MRRDAYSPGDVHTGCAGSCPSIAILEAGEYFGEMALLNQKTRSATVRCIKAMNAISLRQRDFQTLASPSSPSASSR